MEPIFRGHIDFAPSASDNELEWVGLRTPSAYLIRDVGNRFVLGQEGLQPVAGGDCSEEVLSGTPWESPATPEKRSFSFSPGGAGG